MSQTVRILIVVAVLAIIAIIFAVVGAVSQSQVAQMPVTTPQPGMVQLYVDGKFVANLLPTETQKLPAGSFVDKEQSKTQSGQWLRDVIRLYVKETSLSASSLVIITGVRQGTEKKSATLTWAEVLDPANNILYSPSNDGTSVKIAATMDKLSTRNDWVQGLTQIDVKTKP
jgi:hypothetical protein